MRDDSSAQRRTLELVGSFVELLLLEVDDAEVVVRRPVEEVLRERLARNGVGLVQAQRLLGHSDPKLTAKHYVALETKDLRAAMEGLAPKKEKQALERGERQSR